MAPVRGRKVYLIACSSNPKVIQLGPCHCGISLETTSLNGCQQMSTEERSPSFGWNDQGGKQWNTISGEVKISPKSDWSEQKKTNCFGQYVWERTWYVLYRDGARWLPMIWVPAILCGNSSKKAWNCIFQKPETWDGPSSKCDRRIIFSFSVSLTDLDSLSL